MAGFLPRAGRRGGAWEEQQNSSSPVRHSPAISDIIIGEIRGESKGFPGRVRGSIGAENRPPTGPVIGGSRAQNPGAPGPPRSKKRLYGLPGRSFLPAPASGGGKRLRRCYGGQGAVREEADTPPAPRPARPATTPRTAPASASPQASGGNPPSGDMLGPMSEDEHQELAAAVEAAR